MLSCSASFHFICGDGCAHDCGGLRRLKHQTAFVPSDDLKIFFESTFDTEYSSLAVARNIQPGAVHKLVLLQRVLESLMFL